MSLAPKLGRINGILLINNSISQIFLALIVTALLQRLVIFQLLKLPFRNRTLIRFFPSSCNMIFTSTRLTSNSTT